ncbi:hypothetical protein [Actinokineospora inagensis]|uniref:hypothetical protein n=1 Tax=Actinokineospora inagensis TaxID=103730 RepID=UPI00047D5C74|nr:hypothetical protein [Actinokineospora inagensis]
MRILLLPLVLLLAACTSAPPTTSARQAPSVPQFSTSAPKPVPARGSVPTACGKVLTRQDLDGVVTTVITGRTDVVVGVALPKIGRTGRVDCYYGIPAGQPQSAAVLTVGLAGYTDETSARTRIQETVDAERDKGTAPQEIQVGADKGFLLEGPTRTVLAARGKFTVAITAQPAVVNAEQAAKLADLALTEH